METGWIRFIDKMPKIGQKIFIAEANCVYGGISFLHETTFENEEFILIKYPTSNGKIDNWESPIWNSENWTREIYHRDNGYLASYVTHWAYYDKENRGKLNLALTEICETNRLRDGKYCGLMHPIKVQI